MKTLNILGHVIVDAKVEGERISLTFNNNGELQKTEVIAKPGCKPSTIFSTYENYTKTLHKNIKAIAEVACSYLNN
jgi:hypothetical protein